jgi:hypothetical protein
MFSSGSESSISLATVTPSLVTVGELVDAALESRARVGVEV